ncbi:YbhB/YbcL family Raf kinase inhibitor-like protein [Acetivibrio mesophilus]|uniref:Phosphatidylethanolamine-binding protein n=1 Tax=Acetivibrio mesophilus TaxID=2487273 RepID=A0A4Q0I1W3_9FIRM|nr:YbhB/YbcL family Raf kinase inhibitor-like protein [Acetivibrio mesophilus]ODM24570.1 phosphatidylethanolamine-binding protein [Clostridium sp. Bc-iso-3]ODM27085.1 phosphatidylethanolamine-binding protein [Clostridium sp. Bc-iso-3]RXE57655.1 phosphatidylethanolamine-binding protein [Acetivibrio mesophilus]HHV30666.1 phosphatidylethanolamine-binding protein [Clostridium sp.]
MRRLTVFLIICALVTLTFAACSKPKQSVKTIKPGEEIEITSSSLNSDGKWKSVITLSLGENKPPQLSWTPVETASCYAIYMIDISASNWCHWIAKDVKVTELELGAELENSQYIGPYPPGGVHTYEVMIFALKDSPDSYGGYFDNPNPSLDKIIAALDTSKGSTGNILATGVLSGTYQAGDIVE